MATSSLPMDALMMQLMTSRSTALNGAIQSQTQDLQQTNLLIQYANQLVQNLQKPGYSPSVAELRFLLENHIPYSAASTQSTISQLKAFAAQLTSNSQLDMLKLQQMMNQQRNQLVDGTSNTIMFS